MRVRENGQALAEAVVVLSLVVLLMLGMVQFGQIRTAQVLLLMAARQGALVAANSGDVVGEIHKVLGESRQIDPERVEIRVTESWIVKKIHLKYEMPAISAFRRLFPKPFMLQASCVAAHTKLDI